MSMSKVMGWWRRGLLPTVVVALVVAFVAVQPRAARATGTVDAALSGEGRAAYYLKTPRYDDLPAARSAPSATSTGMVVPTPSPSSKTRRLSLVATMCG